MTQPIEPQGLTTEEKVAFASAVDLLRIKRIEAPEAGLGETERALLTAADHITALERRNENLSEQFRLADNRIDEVLKFMRSLRQAYFVARSGTLIGEVKALGTTLRDLQRALGLEPDENEDEN